jgi:acyl carrier protein
MTMIDPAQFISSIRDAFEQPPENLSASSVLRELDGWDSLTSVMLVAEIYADYRVQISGDEMLGCLTVADLIAAVEKKLAGTS